MPFQSEAQRRYLFAKHPRIAKRWAHEYGTPRNLPEHKDEGDSDTKSEKRSSDREVHMTLEEKVIDAFQICDAVIGQAERIQQEKRAADQAIADQIPGVVEVLVTRGLIEPDEKEAAARALRDPVETLNLLKRAAAFVVDDKGERRFGEQVDANGRGTGGSTKKASHVLGSESSPYVGARSTGSKPSDVALLRGLGLA